MWIYVFILLFFFLLVLFVAFKVAKVVMKVIFTLIFIGFVILLVFGYKMYEDSQELDIMFSNATNLYLFADGQLITDGFRSQGFGLLEKNILSEEQINNIIVKYQEGDYADILGDSYKMFIIQKDVIQGSYEDILVEQGPSFIFREYKNGNIEIYPESTFFKSLKYLPDFIVDRMRMLE